MTNLEYVEMDRLINEELDKEEAQDVADEAEVSLTGTRAVANAYGLDKEDVDTLREWGVI